MSRKPRAEVESGIYHVVARGNRKQDTFLDDADRLRYLRTLEVVVKRMEWLCMSYCLMTNHVHLLIETQTPNLGVGMHCLQGKFAQYFNREHGFSGHLYEGRFKDVPIVNDPHLWMVARYIALNPVAAGLCSRPEAYRWSSHAAIVNGDAPDWLAAARLESYFGSQGGEGRQRYDDFVNLSGDRPRLGAL